MKELPDNPSRSLMQAVRNFEKGRYKIAARLCRKELRRSPNDYFALCWYANSLFALGRHNDREAELVYHQAVNINPNHPLAHAGLGIIHYSNAVRLVRESHIPGFPETIWVTFHDELSPEERKSKSSGIFISRADCECGNRKVAINELEEAAKLTNDKDDQIDFLMKAAEIHCLIDNKSAIKAYEKVLHIVPGYVPAHFDLAGCYAATGNSEMALKEYKLIKEKAPEDAEDLRKILAEHNIEIKE